MRTKIGNTDLAVFPLCLGGNTFGWTSDEQQSFAVLDAYVEAGGNFVDTADQYSSWVAGNSGGESETIIGRWFAARGNRDDVVLATKVGRLPGAPGLSAANVAASCDASLRRLGIDHIDLYYAHSDDPNVPLEESLGAFDALVRAGKVRHVAASNYSAGRLAAALDVAARDGLSPFVALQTHYNLVERGYEVELRPVVQARGLSCLPYYALASGFLTGKYQPGGPVPDSPRAGGAGRYLDDRGKRTLEVLCSVAAAHGVAPAAVALAWLAAQPTVAGPIASARTAEQLRDLLAFPTLTLDAADLAGLTEASG